MLNLYKMFRRYSVALLLTMASLSAIASSRMVESFDRQTWQQFQTTLSRPSIVVFTSTDCTFCPAVIEKMAAEIKRRQSAASLVVVVMDEEAENSALLSDPHHQKAQRLFKFSGQPSAIKYSIHPKWRGITPYVALFPKKGQPKLITGSPSAQDIDYWLTL